VGNRLCEEGLAGTRRAVEEHPLGRLDPDTFKDLRPLERELHRFPYLHDLAVEPAYVIIALFRGLDQFHPVHCCIIGLGEDIDDRE